jgi:hypothetical protein
MTQNRGEMCKPARSDRERDYLSLSLMDGSPRYQEAVARLVPDCKNLGDVYRVQTALFRELCAEDPSFARRDRARCDIDLQSVARLPR